MVFSHNCDISMDSRDRWIDNVLIKRLWRSVKHEDTYLYAYRDGREARQRLTQYFRFYNWSAYCPTSLCH